MLEVESTGQRGPTATGSGRISNQAVAGAASVAFTRWLHYRSAMDEDMPIVLCCVLPTFILNEYE